MREVKFKLGHWEGHFWKTRFKLRPEGSQEVDSGDSGSYSERCGGSLQAGQSMTSRGQGTRSCHTPCRPWPGVFVFAFNFTSNGGSLQVVVFLNL